MRHPNVTAAVLILISISSSAIGFLTSILIARWLGVAGFQEYSVAVAAFLLFATIGELGIGKYALRIVPEYRENQDWGLFRGFHYFGVTAVALAGIVLAVTLFTLDLTWPDLFKNPSVGLAAVFIPVSALVATAAELVIANEMAISGVLLTRLICPLLMLGALAWIALTGELTASSAILSFGLSGLVGLGVAGLLVWRATRGLGRKSSLQFHIQSWLRYSIVYWVFAFLTSWIFRISLLVLQSTDVSELEVARFAAALEVAMLVLIVAKSTNKFYQPQLARIMTSGDWMEALRLRRSRRILIGCACLAYLLIVLLFGRMILGWFGPEYPGGYYTLCWLTLGTAVTTIFSMAPEYLKFSDRMGTLLLVYFAAGVGILILTSVLAPRYGATGAGCALSLVLIGTTLTFDRLATRHLFHRASFQRAAAAEANHSNASAD